MNGRIAMGLGAAVLVWAAVTLFEGLWLGGAALVALGGAMVVWGMKQKAKGE
jgi:hypothetical protein